MIKLNKKAKTIVVIFISLVIIALTVEMFLRAKFGLGKTLLFQTGTYEYLQVPNQKVKRMGNISFYNSFSQRNREIAGNDTILGIFFGDSVLNGGVQTDNDSLATSLLSVYWSEKLDRSALALNISAGSWGPDNAFAYLQQFGNFGAKKIVLVFSSHDAYDNMTFEPIVGVHSSYPDKQPLCAISEFVNRYLPHYLPKFLQKSKNNDDEMKDLGINKKTSENQQFNSGFQNFYDYCAEKDMELIIYLHATKTELKAGEYNEQGQEIIDFCEQNKIKIIKEIDYNFPDQAYRDDIHISQYGQRKMFEVLKVLFD